jgi:hypothetical protein
MGCVARAAVVTPDGPHSGPYNARPAVANEFATAYESECEPEGLYGALKMVPGGPYDVEKTIPVQCEFVLALPVSRRG